MEYFRVSYDRVRHDVESETVQLAKRKQRLSADGKIVEGDMVDLLSLTEADEHVINRYFREACDKLVLNMPSTYIADTPTGQPWQGQIVSSNDFNLFLNLTDRWPKGYKPSAEGMMLNFIVNYIVGTWLSGKSNDDAQIYLARLEQNLFDIKRLICRTSRPMRRRPSDI